MDLNFFHNRFTLGYTFYKNNAENQIIPLPVNAATGFTHELINAGNIENKGHEVTLGVGIINTGAFKFDVGLNWARNRNKIIELADGYSYLLGSGEEGVSFGSSSS
ncbi:hypothetical protein [Reichenbachiella ulvae]|uniref:hypothetical protein n=1 Tax=Reichenbachiella ulvae TaxID=2980104 RepID=UPI0038514BBF